MGIVKSILVLILACIIFATPFADVKAASITISPSADVYIYSLSPSFNSGKAINMILMSNSDTQAFADILIKFPLDNIPNNATINRATLQLYLVSGNGKSPVTIAARAADKLWDEGANWSEDVGFVWGGSTTASINNTAGYKTWDVTEMIKNWKNGNVQNNGFILMGITSSGGEAYGRIFRAREGEMENQRPTLTVEYSTPNQLPDLSLQPGVGVVTINEEALQNGSSIDENGDEVVVQNNEPEMVVVQEMSDEPLVNEVREITSVPAENNSNGMSEGDSFTESSMPQRYLGNSVGYLIGAGIFGAMAFVLFILLEMRKFPHEREKTVKVVLLIIFMVAIAWGAAGLYNLGIWTTV